VPGWLNIELIPLAESPYASIKDEGGVLVLSFDLTQGIPIHDNQVNLVYSSHFIEHLTLEEGRLFLKESFRVLASGGRMRITCPVLDTYMQRYLERDNHFFDQIQSYGKAFDDLATIGHVVMGQIQGWGHRWIYDRDMLRYELGKAGFGKVQDSSFRGSDFPDLHLLESNEEAKVVQSLYMEAYKN
jgi:predicted SAM-dependent methyltransferase